MRKLVAAALGLLLNTTSAVADNVFDTVHWFLVNEMGIQLIDTPVRITEASRLDHDLGLDCLDRVEFIAMLEAHFKIEISDEDAEKMVTVYDITSHLRKRGFK